MISLVGADHSRNYDFVSHSDSLCKRTKWSKQTYFRKEKAFIESALDGELTHPLGYEKHDASGRNSGNSRKGSSRKRIKTDDSEVEVQVPRDRRGEFDQQLIAKHQPV